MNFPGYTAGVSIVGALIGIFAVISVWASGLTGFDLIESSLDGFQKFLPLIIFVLSLIVATLSALYVVQPRIFIPFLTFFFGVAIMILTSVFSMWEIDGVKMISDAGIGFWLSYASVAIILLGSAITYSGYSRIPPY